MNKLNIFIAILTSCLFFACTKEQYKGSTLSEAQQYTLSDEYNNFHVRVTKKVITENEKRNEKKQDKSESERRKIMKLNLSLKDFKNKRKKSLTFDFY